MTVNHHYRNLFFSAGQGLRICGRVITKLRRQVSCDHADARPVAGRHDDRRRRRSRGARSRIGSFILVFDGRSRHTHNRTRGTPPPSTLVPDGKRVRSPRGTARCIEGSESRNGPASCPGTGPPRSAVSLFSTAHTRRQRRQPRRRSRNPMVCRR